MEEYKPIAGYDGIYSISSIGNVLRLSTGKVLSAFNDHGGHKVVRLYKNGSGKDYKVHALVLTSFVGPREVNSIACHKDGNPANNNVDNLYWGSYKTNAIDRSRHGNTAVGVRNGNVALTESDVRQIRILAKDKSFRSIGRLYGVSHNCISAVCYKRTWKNV